MSLILLLSLMAATQAEPAPEPAPQAPPAPAERPAPRVSATRAFAPSGDPGIVERTWRLERMNGEAVSSDVTIRLARAGTASGSTGCNRFTARYALDGASLRFVPPLPRAHLVCAPAVTRLEARVRDSLLRVQRWSITPAGDLALELDGGGNLVFHAI